jgi:hypothetical protein
MTLYFHPFKLQPRNVAVVEERKKERKKESLNEWAVKMKKSG